MRQRLAARNILVNIHWSLLLEEKANVFASWRKCNGVSLKGSQNCVQELAVKLS